MFYKDMIKEIEENIESIDKKRFVASWNCLTPEEKITLKDLNDNTFFEDVSEIFVQNIQDHDIEDICKIYNILFDENIEHDEIEFDEDEETIEEEW